MIDEKLIYENKNMIYKIASRYSTCYDIEDLYQVGVIGLIDASKKYDETLNVKFSTFAFKYILGEILKYIKNDRNIRVSPEYLKIYKTYIKSKEILEQKLSKNVSLKEVCQFMQINEEILIDVITSTEFTLSLESGFDGIDLYNFIGKDNINELDMKSDIISSLQSLDELTQKIITFRYYKDYSQSETASLLGLSQSKVSRKENYALKYIKQNIS